MTPITCFDDYQAQSGDSDKSLHHGIWYYALGIAGESGELADKVKKVYRNDGGEFSEANKRALMLEAGDVLWYLARLAHHLGYSLSDVATMNREKLVDRMARGVLKSEGDNR